MDTIYITRDEYRIGQAAGYVHDGLKCTYRELANVNPSEKTMEEMAEYSDITIYVKTLAKDADFCTNHISLTRKSVEEHDMIIDPATIGNMAFLALKFEDDEIKQSAREVYGFLISHFNRQRREEREKLRKLLRHHLSNFYLDAMRTSLH